MIERRPFGRTGHLSTVTLFGAAALARASQADADRTLEVLLRYGVNHIDTAARYGDSELRIGPWMARHRKDFFLATKTGIADRARGPRGHPPLARAAPVDHVDLIQLHSLGHPDDWDQAMGPGGALEAVVEARDAGSDALHRRHRPRLDDRRDAPAQPRALRLRLGPAPVQLLHGEQRALPPRVRGRAGDLPGAPGGGAGHQVASRAGPGPPPIARTRTWYQPLEAQADIDRACTGRSACPDVFLNTAGDLTLLPKILDAASRFTARPPNDAMEAMLAAARMTSLFGLPT